MSSFSAHRLISNFSGVVGLFAIFIAGVNILLPLRTPNLTKM
jgi:hypothetical protein